jgi:hypothetical protein
LLFLCVRPVASVSLSSCLLFSAALFCRDEKRDDDHVDGALPGSHER